VGGVLLLAAGLRAPALSLSVGRVGGFGLFMRVCDVKIVGLSPSILPKRSVHSQSYLSKECKAARLGAERPGALAG
jgi:hypothetical protein